uniref:NRF domain-containing protein n=3 Tax=Caenorhabditis tropicalis TaxID=1561998 RepID=A0A1I7V2N3_9PELO
MMTSFLFLFFIPSSLALYNNVFQTKPLRNLSTQCQNETDTWLNSIEIFATVSLECLVKKNCSLEELKVLEDNLYAIQQIDSFGQFPGPGLLELKTLYDGSYQECQEVEKYQTNYCYLLIRPGTSCETPFELPLRLAVCLPYSCSPTEMVEVFNQLTIYPFTACSAYCARNEVKKDTSFWGYSIFLMVIAGIAILASLLDFLGLKNTPFLKILYSFSLWTNAELLLSVKDHKPGFIKSLDCLRFFSIFWVVTGHSFSYFILGDTLKPALDFPKHFWNHLLLNAYVSVDTFFIIEMISNPVTWILFYVHRYLRLTPPVMFFIGFFTVYAPYIQGSFAASELNALSAQANACRTYWWQNLLYINNFDSSAGDNLNTCYGVTWYLAVDTQLYLIAPVVLVSLYVSFAAGVTLVMAGCVGSITATYILYGNYDIQADGIGEGNQDNFFDIIYSKPWIRCPPYLIGILNGYLLATYGSRRIRLNWALSLVGWLTAFIIAGFCLSATYDYDKGSHWSWFTRASFYNFHRIGWSFLFAGWYLLTI